VQGLPPRVTTARITDPEIAMLESHLRLCCPDEPLEVSPMLGNLMRRVHLVVLEEQ